jgi:c-di-GMP-binding flagellar brake protein YcgR
MLEKRIVRKMRERRMDARYPSELEAEYSFDSSIIGIKSPTRTFNISKSGVGLTLSRAIEDGDEILIKIKIPLGNREISAIGEVEWTKLAEDDTDGHEEAGVRFLTMDEESQDTLDAYLHEIQ